MIVAVPIPVNVITEPVTVATFGSDEVYVNVPAASEVGGTIVCGASPSCAVIAVKFDNEAGLGIEPATTVLKTWPAQVPDTALHVAPLSVDLEAENVGAGVTSVDAGDEHFQPVVPPVLPVNTTWYVAPGVRARGDANVNVSFSCPHTPIERLDTAVASTDPGLPASSERISTL